VTYGKRVKKLSLLSLLKRTLWFDLDVHTPKKGK